MLSFAQAITWLQDLNDGGREGGRGEFPLLLFAQSVIYMASLSLN